MDKKNLIIIILILYLFVMVITMVVITHSKDTDLNILCESTLQNNDTFSIILTDNDGNPISNKNVSIDIIDANGEHNIQNLTTDENGTASFIVNLTEGDYTFNCTFKGDFDFKSSYICQNITIKQPVIEYSSNGISDPGAIYDWATGTGWHYTGEVIYDPRSGSYWRHDGYNHFTEL